MRFLKNIAHSHLSAHLEVASLHAFNPPFHINPPKNNPVPVIFNSPHSGRIYPDAFIRQSLLSKMQLRKNEDAFIDILFNSVTHMGAHLMCAHFPRCFVDINRAPYDLPFCGDEHPHPISQRAAFGFGVIPTVIAEGMDIYKRPLKPEVIQARLDRIYKPYHAALHGLIHTLLGMSGRVLLLDCHSMPSQSPSGVRRPDIILGDRHGLTCRPETLYMIERNFRKLGYEVERNYPYAGGYITSHYGHPKQGIEVVQIEINRDLYLDQGTLKLKTDYNQLQDNLRHISHEIISEFNGFHRVAAQ